MQHFQPRSRLRQPDLLHLPPFHSDRIFQSDPMQHLQPPQLLHQPDLLRLPLFRSDLRQCFRLLRLPFRSDLRQRFRLPRLLFRSGLLCLPRFSGLTAAPAGSSLLTFGSCITCRTRAGLSVRTLLYIRLCAIKVCLGAFSRLYCSLRILLRITLRPGVTLRSFLLQGLGLRGLIF